MKVEIKICIGRDRMKDGNEKLMVEDEVQKTWKDY